MHPNRKFPFQSPPPNKILYQDDYSSPQLVFLPQTPDSTTRNQGPICFEDFDNKPMTPIISNPREEPTWNGDEVSNSSSSAEGSTLVLTESSAHTATNMNGTIFYNERPISPIPLENAIQMENKDDEAFMEEDSNLSEPFGDEKQQLQQGERIDVNDKVSIKKNKKNKMIRMVDEEDEYDDPFSHVPEVVISEEVEVKLNNTSSIEERPSKTINTNNIRLDSKPPMTTALSSSSMSRPKSPVEEYGFERDNMQEELMEVKNSKKIQERFSNLVTGVEKLGNKLLSPSTNRFSERMMNRDSGADNHEAYEITSDKKKMLSDDRGNVSATMSGILDKLSSFKLSSSTAEAKDQVPPTEEEEEDSFLNDIILSTSQNQNTSFANKQSYLPNANIPQTSSTNTSFMGQSWVEKLRRIDVSADIAHEFFVSCQESDLDSVKSYIEEKNLNVNTKDLVGYGQTAMHYACWNGSLKLVEYLLSKDASVDALNDYKQTPLHEAAFRGHPDIVSLLLKSGADKSCTDHVGETALDYAKKKRNEATNFTSESLYKDVIKALDSHIGDASQRKRTIPCCFQ